MDIQTVQQKMNDGKYANAHEFMDDIYLIFDNAMVYSDEPSNFVHQTAKELKKLSETKFSRVRTTNRRWNKQTLKNKITYSTRQRLKDAVSSFDTTEKLEHFFLELAKNCPQAVRINEIEGTYELFLDRCTE